METDSFRGVGEASRAPLIVNRSTFRSINGRVIAEMSVVKYNEKRRY